jgi:hypothetical protein
MAADCFVSPSKPATNQRKEQEIVQLEDYVSCPSPAKEVKRKDSEVDKYLSKDERIIEKNRARIAENERRTKIETEH